MVIPVSNHFIRNQFERAACTNLLLNQPYAAIPATASSMPTSFRPVMMSLRSSQPKNSTSTVFVCPRTWNVTAWNRPRHMNWLTFTCTTSKGG